MGGCAIQCTSRVTACTCRTGVSDQIVDDNAEELQELGARLGRCRQSAKDFRAEKIQRENEVWKRVSAVQGRTSCTVHYLCIACALRVFLVHVFSHLADGSRTRTPFTTGQRYRRRCWLAKWSVLRSLVFSWCWTENALVEAIELTVVCVCMVSLGAALVRWLQPRRPTANWTLSARLRWVRVDVVEYGAWIRFRRSTESTMWSGYLCGFLEHRREADERRKTVGSTAQRTVSAVPDTRSHASLHDRAIAATHHRRGSAASRHGSAGNIFIVPSPVTVPRHTRAGERDAVDDDDLGETYSSKSTAFKSLDATSAATEALNLLPTRTKKYIGRDVVLNSCRRGLKVRGNPCSSVWRGCSCRSVSVFACMGAWIGVSVCVL